MSTLKSCLVLDAKSVRARKDELSEVLTDCVTHGASVSFLLPFEPHKAHIFWEEVANSVERGNVLSWPSKIIST